MTKTVENKLRLRATAPLHPLQPGQGDLMPSFLFIIIRILLIGSSQPERQSFVSVALASTPPLATMSMGDCNAQPAGPMLMAATPP